MKKWISLLITGLLLFASLAFAQASGLSPGTTETDGGWSPEESGHYVHKRSKKMRKPATDDEEESSQKASPIPMTPISPRLVPETTNVTPAIPTQESSSNQPQTFSSKVRDFVMGGDSDLIQNYKNFLDRQDIRKNFFEFSLAMGYFYNVSSSPFFNRNYNDAAPTADIGADIWLTPFFGIDADYRATLLNELNDSPTGPSTVNITQNWLDLGIKFRRFFGMSANSTIFTSAVRYSDFSVSVPTVSQSRVSLDTQGLEFDFDLTMPVGKNTSVNAGFMLEPIASQSERTGASITSGSSNQTMGAGANLGLNYRVTRQMVGFMKLSSLLYKTEFTGSTSKSDPVAGIPLTNVPVTNVFYLLEFGLRLGN